MTDLRGLGLLLDDGETHALVVNALTAAAAEYRGVAGDAASGVECDHFKRVSSVLESVVAALYAVSGALSEPGDTFADILADRAARETLIAALMMYGQAVLEVWETSIDVSVCGRCELTTANVEWVLEVTEATSPHEPPHPRSEA